MRVVDHVDDLVHGERIVDVRVRRTEHRGDCMPRQRVNCPPPCWSPASSVLLPMPVGAAEKTDETNSGRRGSVPGWPPSYRRCSSRTRACSPPPPSRVVVVVVDVDVVVEFVVDVSVVVMSASPTLASVAAIAKPHTEHREAQASRVAYYGGSSYSPPRPCGAFSRYKSGYSTATLARLVPKWLGPPMVPMSLW